MRKIKKICFFMSLLGILSIIYGILPTPLWSKYPYNLEIKQIANKYVFIGIGGVFLVISYTIRQLVEEVHSEAIYMAGKISDLEDRIKNLEDK